MRVGTVHRTALPTLRRSFAPNQGFHVVMSLSNAMTAELTYARGRAVQSNLNEHRVMRMAGVPKEIRVHLVDAGGPIGGMGEPGVPPVAPAFANAVAAVRSTRARSLPSLP